MKRKVFGVLGVAAFGVAMAYSFNARIGDNINLDISLNSIEALVMGECTASPKNCSKSCTGDTYCISYDDSASCDGNHVYC